jgi:hypothetical protein
MLWGIGRKNKGKKRKIFQQLETKFKNRRKNK